MTMSAAAPERGRQPRGRPLQERPRRVLHPKTHRTITIPQEIDEQIVAKRAADGTTYSQVVEDALRAHLGDARTVA